MLTPLFVLGKHRSGTTWLANQLCQHSRIAGVQHPEHHGVHESGYFSHIVGRYGDLTEPQNFSEFVEVMAASDLVRLIGVDREYLYGLWPATYADVFRAMMDSYAAVRGADFWLDKSPKHTLVVEEIAHHYPDARFIAVVREPAAVVASSVGRSREIWGETRTRPGFVIRTTASWMRYRAAVARFARSASERLLLVRFDDLRRDLERPLRQVCSFLGIEFEPAMCQQAFAPNTSFRTERERTAVLSPLEERFVKMLSRAWPCLMLWSPPVRRSRSDPLPSWFFRLLWNELAGRCDGTATVGSHVPTRVPQLPPSGRPSP